MEKLSIIGKNVPRVDVSPKVTGAARYPTDLRLPQMLYGKIIRSPYAHARIISIDTSRAERLPGVVAIVTALNTPPIPLVAGFCDKYLFPTDLITRFDGDEVAALAAESEDIAETAASLIKVEYEELPALFDLDQAFSKNPSVIIHPLFAEYYSLAKKSGHRLMRDPERPNVNGYFKITKGDIEKGFREADLILEDSYYTPKLQHSQIEPSSCIAHFESDGTLRIHASLQGPNVAKLAICHAFNLPSSKVIIECPCIGGSFGGKIKIVAEPYAVLLSMKSHGRPVRVSLTREEHFHCGHSRIAVKCNIKDGVKKDGTIICRQLQVFVDTGAYADAVLGLVRGCAFGAVSLYKIPNFKFDSYGLYTNTEPASAFRGYGSTEISWAIENQMDTIAEKLGMDPYTFRRKNLLKQGDRDICGQVVESIGAEKCLDKVKKWIDQDKKPVKQEGVVKKGKGLALATKFTSAGFESSATVKVLPDGYIEIHHSSNEIGEGIDTVSAQIAAESFGTSLEYVRVFGGNTAICPFGHSSVSSRETFHIGNAIIRACEDIKKEIYELAAPKLGVSTQFLGIKDRKIFVKKNPEKFIEIASLFNPPGFGSTPGKCEIMGKCTFKVEAIPEDSETGQSEKIAAYYMYGAQAVEVAIDTETGELTILRNIGCFDGGTPINPQMCEGQIEGGMVMAFGAALHEKLQYNLKGSLLNPNFHDYRIPTTDDLPDNTNMVSLLAPAPHPEGPFGAKGIGEISTIPGPPAISNAIYNAIGVRIKELPITSEKILNALKIKNQGSKT